MPKIISECRKKAEFRKRTVKSTSFFAPEYVISEILDHADEGLDENEEIMGLIIGTVYRDDIGEYAVAGRIATSKLIADPISVQFDIGDLEKMFDTLEFSQNETVIGWYHSHLDIGCFMSETDVKTQDGIFGGELGFALVVDPVRKEMKVFDTTPGNPKEVDMLIIESD